ncbi:MAG: glycosyltransferase family 4 protein [bacterium]|nr:glycosyltransferase family 4 protein [bacterium]
MHILFVDAFDRANFSTRWRTYCVGNYLTASGHQISYWHLSICPKEVPVVHHLPPILQRLLVRLLMPIRARRVPALAARADRVIVLNAYSSPWLARTLAQRPNGFVYDTVDFADNEDFIRLHCPPGWRGALMRWRMRRNYRNFLSYVDAARLVCTNNFLCVEQVRARGKDAFLFIDPIPSSYLQPLQQKPLTEPVRIGWCGHPATCHYMAEYLDVFRSFTASGRVAIDLMEGEPTLAARIGARIIPWTEANFKHHVPRWDIGIAPLPSYVPFTGKFPGKILQYMAAGIPSIVTPKGMATHFIKDGETGLYAHTPADWQRCITYLLDHPQERARMGAHARADFEHRFSLEAQMPTYLNTILGVNPQPPSPQNGFHTLVNFSSMHP